jgi:hypothetical protein
MNLAILLKIGGALFQAVEAGITYGPAIIEDLKRVWDLASSGTALTPEQIADADAAVAAAHQELQAAIAKDAQDDGA